MTTIIKAPGIIIPGLSKLYRDKIITAGSMYLYDMEDAYVNPYTRSANLAAAAAVRNMVNSGASALVFGASVANGAAGKGIRLPGVNDNGLDFGTGFDPGQNSFMVILWLMARTGDTPSANSHIFGKNTGTGTGQYFVHGGADGKTLNVSIGLNGTLNSAVSVGGSPLGTNTVEQIAFAWTGGARHGWRNGVLQQTQTNAASTLNSGAGITEGVGRKTTAGSTSVLGFNTGWQGSIFRAYKENLTTYSADQAVQLTWASAQVLADYQNNVARFS